MADKVSQMGIIISGQVMTKNEYPGKDGNQTRYSVDVAIPGQKEMLSVNCEPDEYFGLNVMENYKGHVSYNLFKGRIYWKRAA